MHGRRNVFLIAGIAAIAGLPMGLAAESDEMEIGIRSSTPKEHEWLKKDLTAAAYAEDAAQAAKRLAQEKLDAYELAAITDAVKKDSERAAHAFAACLNPKSCPDPLVRRGAVKGMSIAAPKPGGVSRMLAAVVMSETDPQVRAVVVELLKQRKDPIANKTLVDYYVDAFDSDGVLLKADHERAAIAAMRDVGGRQIYEALLAYVTMEVHAGSATEAGPPQTVYITNGGSINNPNGSINLPIELPNLELRGYSGTLIIPAFGALKQVTGQNFGKHLEKWQNWIAKQD